MPLSARVRALLMNASRRRVRRGGRLSDRQLLRAFLESVPLQVYFKDRESRFIAVSQLQASRLGFGTGEALLGKTDHDVFTLEHAHPALETERQIMASGRPALGFEERETLLDGREAWVATSKLPLRDENGWIVGTFGISTDITLRKRAQEALRRSEARWRALLDRVQEMILLVNHDGELTYASPAVQRWLGYREDELVGSQVGRLTHEQDTTAVRETFAAATAGESRSVRYRVRAADGSWHWLESSFSPLDDDPDVAAVLVSARDITDEIALQEQRERLEAERRVSQRLEAVGQLAAGMAHEINTPLQFVGDSMNFLSEAVDELLILTGTYREAVYHEEIVPHADRRRAIAQAEEIADLDYLLERLPAAFKRTADGIERVRTIVLAMKRFSHTGGTDAAPADLNEAIETTLEVCRSEYKHIAAVRFMPGELPLVRCTVSEINQVLLNLVLNAAQAIGEKVGDGGTLGRIDIDTRHDDAFVTIRITDDGPGIPPELQERIYEPFFTTKEVGKGTGQGLALARTTIDRHGGTLQCTSTPGEGTTFTIRLPVHGTGDMVSQPTDLAA